MGWEEFWHLGCHNAYFVHLEMVLCNCWDGVSLRCIGGVFERGVSRLLHLERRHCRRFGFLYQMLYEVGVMGTGESTLLWIVLRWIHRAEMTQYPL
jgi:hypothetical protein